MAGLHRLVAYEWVATARKGASGLGSEAQRKTIKDFAWGRGASAVHRGREWPYGGPAGTGKGAALVIATA